MGGSAVPASVVAELVAAAREFARVGAGEEPALLARLAATAVATAEAFCGITIFARLHEDVVPVASGWQRLRGRPVSAIAGVAAFITKLAPCRYGARSAWTRSISRSAGFAPKSPGAPEGRYWSVPNARAASPSADTGPARNPLGRLTPDPLTNAAPSARANSLAISPASHSSTSNAASSSIAWLADGLA